MTDPASIAEEDYDEHDWYVAKSLPSAFNGYATAYFACTDKTPTNAIRIAHADTHLAAMAIVDALNTADARDADYQALFAAYSGLKADFQTLFAAYTESRQHTDSAIDALKDENAALSADRDHLVARLASVHSELARVTAQPDTLRKALVDTLSYVPAAMRDKLVNLLGYDFEPEEVEP